MESDLVALAKIGTITREEFDGFHSTYARWLESTLERMDKERKRSSFLGFAKGVLKNVPFFADDVAMVDVKRQGNAQRLGNAQLEYTLILNLARLDPKGELTPHGSREQLISIARNAHIVTVLKQFDVIDRCKEIDDYVNAVDNPPFKASEVKDFLKGACVEAEACSVSLYNLLDRCIANAYGDDWADGDPADAGTNVEPDIEEPSSG